MMKEHLAMKLASVLLLSVTIVGSSKHQYDQRKRSDDSNAILAAQEQQAVVLSQLKAQVSSLQAQIDQKLAAKQAQCDQKIFALRAEHEQKISALEATVGDMSTPLVFTAEGGRTHAYNNGDIITFSRVITNVGSMYSTLTGVVTVPRDGVYLVYARVDPEGGDPHQLAFDVRVNDKHVIYAYGEGSTTGGVTVALLLKVNDTVHVTKRNGGLSQSASVFSVVRVSL